VSGPVKPAGTEKDVNAQLGEALGRIVRADVGPQPAHSFHDLAEIHFHSATPHPFGHPLPI
jgi:hypothetical protein